MIEQTEFLEPERYQSQRYSSLTNKAANDRKNLSPIKRNTKYLEISNFGETPMGGGAPVINYGVTIRGYTP